MEWISVKDRFPKPFYAVLVARFDGEFYTIGKDAYQFGNKFAYDGDEKGKVTHWMPLPEPPKP